MLHTPELREAIENLYRVFQSYELRSNTGACDCHHTPEDETRLHSKPLNKLSASDLQQYAVDAVYLWGTGDDFKYFIPRLLELLAQSPAHEHDFAHPADIFAKLSYESWCSTHWRTWPEIEQNALLEYFRAAWDAALRSTPECPPLDEASDWLQALAQVEHDLMPYLDYWLNAESVNAHRNLALLITRNGLPRRMGAFDGYWGGHREQWAQLNDWLRRPEVRRKLANAFERWSDLPFASELMDAAVLLPEK